MRRTLPLAVPLLAVVLVLAACSSGEGSNDAGSPPATGAASPTASSTGPAVTGVGQEIAIGADGFSPRWLLAVTGKQITWTNDTSKPQSVVFDILGVKSGTIGPGGTFSWRPTSVVSLTYHNGLDPEMKAKVQVQEPAAA